MRCLDLLFCSRPVKPRRKDLDTGTALADSCVASPQIALPEASMTRAVRVRARVAPRVVDVAARALSWRGHPRVFRPIRGHRRTSGRVRHRAGRSARRGTVEGIAAFLRRRADGRPARLRRGAAPLAYSQRHVRAGVHRHRTGSGPHAHGVAVRSRARGDPAGRAGSPATSFRVLAALERRVGEGRREHERAAPCRPIAGSARHSLASCSSVGTPV